MRIVLLLASLVFISSRNLYECVSASSFASSSSSDAEADAAPYPFNNESLSVDARADDLLSRLTLDEKVGMMFMDATRSFGNDTQPRGGDYPSTSVPRLGVPQFNWMGQSNVYRGASNGCTIGCCTSCPTTQRSIHVHDTNADSHLFLAEAHLYRHPSPQLNNDCCHNLYATQLPQGTGVAATFNPSLVFAVASMVANESWGLQNGVEFSERLTEFRTGASSLLNVLRDGRWGRAPETYGECPVLVATIALAFNKGLVGFDSLTSFTPPTYFKVVPILRHAVAYAGPESGRFSTDLRVSDDDLELTHYPPWRLLIEQGVMGGVMSAITALNGVPQAVQRNLLTRVLKMDYGFDGFVMSDCDTIPSVTNDFHYTTNVMASVAIALEAGGDLGCGSEYAMLANATLLGLTEEKNAIDPAVRRLLRRRVQVGALNVGERVTPYSDIPLSVVDSVAHRKLARQMVRESVVLLRNDVQTLPLNVNRNGTGNGDRFSVVRNRLYRCVVDIDDDDDDSDNGSPPILPKCLTGHPLCNAHLALIDEHDAGVSKKKVGECSLPRKTAFEICAAWAECAALVCEHARDDCQARGWAGLDFHVLLSTNQQPHQGARNSDSSSFAHDSTPTPSADTYLRLTPVRNLLLVGPSAADASIQAHTYHGTPWRWTTPYLALNESTAVRQGTLSVTYLQGCEIDGDDRSGFKAVLEAAASEEVDAIWYVGGLARRYEEEDGDRDDFRLPQIQFDLLQRLVSVTRSRTTFVPLVITIVSGGPVAEPWLSTSDNTIGVALTWLSYYGQDGAGLVDVVLGDYSPSGRLPFTIPVNTSQLSTITQYNMRAPPFGRTYRYQTYDLPAALPLYPFGFGLSYFDIMINSIKPNLPSANLQSQNVPFIVTLTNKGAMATGSSGGQFVDSADYVVSLFGSFYTCDLMPSPVKAMPLRQLLVFEKFNFPAGEARSVELAFNLTSIAGVKRHPFPGWLKVWVGDGGPCNECAYTWFPLTLADNVPCSII